MTSIEDMKNGICTMDNAIDNYCIDLIINSSVEDWSFGNSGHKSNDKHPRLNKGNIVIYNYHNREFHVQIYSDKSLSDSICSFDVIIRVPLFGSKELKRIRRLLRMKYKETKEYFTMKAKYNFINDVYNTLPITEIRKHKLLTLENSENDKKSDI